MKMHEGIIKQHVRMWDGLIWFRIEFGGRFCEFSNKLSSFMIDGNFLTTCPKKNF